MTIDPKTLPEETVVECVGGIHPHYRDASCDPKIARVFVPVPEGMTYADAVAALADAGAWVEVPNIGNVPDGARLRNEWLNGDSAIDRIYVHRDDLPPADPDAELVEKMARAMYAALKHAPPWDDRASLVRDQFLRDARAALAIVREHEARS